MLVKYERLMPGWTVVECEADEREFVPRFSANGLLFDDYNRLLVFESVNRRLFDVPGGEIEPGETALDAVRREFKEETGLVIEVGSKIAEGVSFFSYFDKPPFRNIREYFVVWQVGGALLENGNGADSFRMHWKYPAELNERNTLAPVLAMLRTLVWTPQD